MSRELIESIVAGDFVCANQLFEEQLEILREQKLYEEKRRIAALHEIFGGMSKKETEARRAAGYRKASEVLGDPDKPAKLSSATKKYRATLVKKKKKVSEETLDEMRAPGEVPGSDERKLNALQLRALRKVVASDKKAASAFRSEYLSKRKAQIAPEPRITTTDAKKRPGVIRRNINTLMGRDAGYVKPEKSPEEKEMQRGGRVGKGLRMAGKGISKAYGAWGNVVRSGMSGALEE